jgi:phosphatidylserine decarboxylase
MSLVFVGATNVGSMTLGFDPVKKNKKIKLLIFLNFSVLKKNKKFFESKNINLFIFVEKKRRNN